MRKIMHYVIKDYYFSDATLPLLSNRGVIKLKNKWIEVGQDRLGRNLFEQFSNPPTDEKDKSGKDRSKPADINLREAQPRLGLARLRPLEKRLAEEGSIEPGSSFGTSAPITTKKQRFTYISIFPILSFICKKQ